MYSYHIVAELRQFRGALSAWNGRVHKDMPADGNGFPPSRLDPGMDRFFLAMMVSAVLVLIVASDLLVNGAGLQEPPANVASLMPAGHLIR
ncbi:histidine kinase [Bradyrhizobium guangxiense]|uniref:histidine kinase n=1 Tax=Bradyrhizobium guangxiense TaxID=1325115 RepID=UPI0013E8C24F|nr:histidine kinase [Bradyrhizobium guangxiense]